ncbi:MAG TPA: protein kinase [Gemmatimonadales bacterium]|nr:protein kinase [Gemmatimonadales bacterium]
MPELLGRLQSALADRYRLDREVGAGGMATVYLAQDIRHARRVALKVLRPELAAVIGAERFLAEIQLTANLQHPHILPLFDSGEADGYLFYVMPFVEGETLRDRLTREKQLAVPEAIRIAEEVAAALDYAHRHGVVHRDIKPENILLHDGSALVADFGIALAASKAGGARMTETGMSLGTPHYMSPEQAMGEREITARSDVYALGCVLYEMLTGEPPFTGATAQAVVARVVTEAPRPLHAQRHTIPAHVEAAVLTALEKLPADRFASAADFATALRNKSYATTAAVPVAQAPSREPVQRRDARLVAALGLAGVAAAAGLWGWVRPAPREPMTQFSVALRKSEELQPPPTAGGGRIAISPDGRQIVFTGPGQGTSQLWLRRLDQLTSTPISGTEGGYSPFFSPDGRQVGFIRNGGTLRIASLDGTPTVTLIDTANTVSADWSTDGWIYVEGGAGVLRVRPTGGAVEPVYAVSAERHEIGAEFLNALPGGGLLYRLRYGGKGQGEFQIAAMKVPGGTPKLLTRGVFGRYAPSGHLLVVTAEGKLIAIPFDAKKLELTGPPIALLEGVGVRVGGFSVDLALSQTGTLVYTTGGAIGTRRVVWVTREGGASLVDPNWDPQGTIDAIALSPDEKTLAVALSRNGKSDIWVKALPTGPFSRITFGDTGSTRPVWAPDSRSLLYLADRAGSGVGPVYEHRADGTGNATLVFRGAMDWGQIVPSRDGRWLILRNAPNAGNPGIFGVRQGDTAAAPLVSSAAASNMYPALSPDERWLAYASDESGTMEIYVRPFPETSSAKWQVSTAGGLQPVWSKSGRELYYVNGKNELVAADIRPGATFAVGEQRALFSFAPFLRLGPIPSYGVTADDKRFVMVREGESAQESELIVALHWLDALKAKGER